MEVNDIKPIEKSAPEKIYLQWHGDADPEIETAAVHEMAVTWSRERVFDNDIEYVMKSFKSNPV